MPKALKHASSSLSPQLLEGFRQQIYGVMRAIGLSTEDRPVYSELCLGIEDGCFTIWLADTDNRIEFSVSARFNSCRTNLVHGLVLIEADNFSVQSDVRSDLNRLVKLSTDVSGVFKHTIGFIQTIFNVNNVAPHQMSYLRARGL